MRAGHSRVGAAGVSLKVQPPIVLSLEKGGGEADLRHVARELHPQADRDVELGEDHRNARRHPLPCRPTVEAPERQVLAALAVEFDGSDQATIVVPERGHDVGECPELAGQATI